MDESKVNYLSLAQLEQDSDEIVGLRSNVDANSFLPPLVHGDYEGMLRFDDDHADPDKRWLEDVSQRGEPKKYNKTQLLFVTDGNADELANGREFTAFCSTLLRKGGTTSAQAALQGVGASVQEIDSNKTRNGQCLLVNKYMEGPGSPATAEIDWETSLFDAEYQDPETGEKVGKEFYRIRGMERFPQATEGEGEFEKSIPSADGKKRFYPWVDLDVTDMNDTTPPVVVLPSTPQEQLTGRNIRRCFARNFLRRFLTRTDLSGAGGAAKRGGSSAVAARPVAAPQNATPSPTSATVGAGATKPAGRPSPVRR
jgi:hypothetical protein